MPAVLFDPKALLDTAGPPKIVTPRLSDTELRARSAAINSAANPSTRFGVWECSPGRWRREVRQAEFCHFLSGRATFTPDDGPPLEITAGDAVHFSASTRGVWETHETCVKLFIVYDEEAGQ
ncbi:cupin domain-containing protein [Sphingobium chungangianum]